MSREGRRVDEGIVQPFSKEEDRLSPRLHHSSARLVARGRMPRRSGARSAPRSRADRQFRQASSMGWLAADAFWRTRLLQRHLQRQDAVRSRQHGIRFPPAFAPSELRRASHRTVSEGGPAVALAEAGRNLISGQSRSPTRRRRSQERGPLPTTGSAHSPSIPRPSPARSSGD